ncbi:acyl-CoA dehydrogenase family protein [Rothia uropygialis]|uniref:acyl-CoA dehydrogenase family protein n=1 Tax=Kocuria sp. 36 TaxID=1415402 RepID=UPI00101C126D|nr:acyl-CoA dehydrogenase family protein [Kocuria sp. 36]
MSMTADPTRTLFPLSDPLGVSASLNDSERGLLLTLQKTLERDIAPLVNEAWDQARFPQDIVQPLVDLDLVEPAALDADPRPLFRGFRCFTLARTDASVATFHTAQAGLFRTAVLEGGDNQMVTEWRPKIASWERFGVFCLTEPEHGSDVAGGLATSARREGETWRLNGTKRWIGAATQADWLAVFARDDADGQVKGFLVPSDAPGVSMETISGKSALRIVQNAEITLEDVSVQESLRLKNVRSFKDVARMLRLMRSDVAWIAAGVAAGAFEAALRYVDRRRQFGVPLGSFQLVQEKLARMQGNVAQALSLCASLSEAQENGTYRDEHSALTKSTVCLRMRETVALAREVCGGNGITLEADVARYFADAEAIYSYEGTHEINSLIVGRALTGIGSFLPRTNK